MARKAKMGFEPVAIFTLRELDRLNVQHIKAIRTWLDECIHGIVDNPRAYGREVTCRFNLPESK